MSATLTLDLFRPSILDPVDQGERLRGPGFVRDRQSSERNTAPAVPMGGDGHTHGPRAERSGGATLDELIVGAWEGLVAHRTVACLACGEAMVPRYSAGPAPVGGRCTACGTTMS
jgi:hypothetical protein